MTNVVLVCTIVTKMQSVKISTPLTRLTRSVSDAHVKLGFMVMVLFVTILTNAITIKHIVEKDRLAKILLLLTKNLGS